MTCFVLRAEKLASPVPMVSTPLLELLLPVLSQQEIQEQSPSPLMGVTLPLRSWLPLQPVEVREGISPSQLEVWARSTQLVIFCNRVALQEAQETSPSQLLG